MAIVFIFCMLSETLGVDATQNCSTKATVQDGLCFHSSHICICLLCIFMRGVPERASNSLNML